MTSGQRKIALFPVLIYATAAPLEPFSGGGLISAILRRQSASESCGPETNVPLTLVEYQPDTTPSRTDSSVLTWRGERFCMGFFHVERSILHRTKGEVFSCPERATRVVQLSS